jgi:diacylglycerol kinase (ATP)
VAGLGQYFGGGIKITPQASPQSGSFQVVWDNALNRRKLLSLLGKTMRGMHLSHPQVQTCFAQRLQLWADPPAVVQVEGEPVGLTPLEAAIAPETLDVAA